MWGGKGAKITKHFGGEEQDHRTHSIWFQELL